MTRQAFQGNSKNILLGENIISVEFIELVKSDERY